MSTRQSTLSAERLPRRLRDTYVVDVDVHIHDSPDALAPYCDLPWRKSLETVAALPQRYLDVPGFAPAAYPHPLFGTGSRKPDVQSPEEMRRDLDDLGINLGVLFPDNLLLHAAIRPAAYGVAVARAYNRWLIDEWLAAEHGLVGAILAPHHDPSAAAAEIRRYAGHPRVRAVFLPSSCVEPLYGSRWYDPLYEEAQEAELPVILHSVTAYHPAFPCNLWGFDTAFGAHTVSHGFSMAANLVSIIETGVPVRFPRLRICFAEAGLAWVPWIMLRLDKEYLERRREVPFLKERPSHYVKKFFFATQPIEEPPQMRDVATLMSLFHGTDNVVFASDWPHHDFDHPRKILQMGLSEEDLKKVLGGNAVRLLGVEPPAR